MIFPVYIVDNQAIYKHGLWFDVERIWETTKRETKVNGVMLWFDVERIWETTVVTQRDSNFMLWFDVERIWETTQMLPEMVSGCCGLM